MSRQRKKYANGQPRAPKGAANPRTSAVKTYKKDTEVTSLGIWPYQTPKE